MSHEIEFKFRVETEEALDAFARAVGLERGDHAAHRQTNTFFDSRDGRLGARGLALRLREEEGRAWLTIKGKGSSRSADGALVARFEAELEVDPGDARPILAGTTSPLALLEATDDAGLREGASAVRAALDGAELVRIGTFENARTTLPRVSVDVGGHRERLVFELDRTTFPGGRTDFEIEAEIGPKVEAEPLWKRLCEVLEQAGIRWTPAPSKLARFLEALAQEGRA